MRRAKPPRRSAASRPSQAPSPGREQLRALGLDLPLLPLTAVGSFPKPPALRQARAKAAQGQLFAADLEAEERRATESWIRAQEQAGLDVLVDGEMYRGGPVAYFAENLPGFYPGGWVRVHGNRYHRKPVIVGEVRWPGPITVARWRFAQGLTRKPVKAVITGPYTLMDRSFDEYHSSREAACLALAAALRLEVDALAAAGAKIVQIDEPSLAARPEEMPFAKEALIRVAGGVPVYRVLHVCRGDLTTLLSHLPDLPFHNFDLELSRSGAEFLAGLRRVRFTGDVTAGLVDALDPALESPGAVRRALLPLIARLGPDRLWADPDCGFRGLTTDQARAKLAVLADAVRRARKGFPAPAL